MARLNARPQVFHTKGKEETSFARSDYLKQFDSLLSKERAEANSWRFVGLIMLLSLVICFGILFYVVTRPEQKFVVIDVNDIGETKYHGVVSGIDFDSYNNKDPIIKNMLQDFIYDTYLISTDPDLMYRNFVRTMNHMIRTQRKLYEDKIREEDPFKYIGSIKRNTRIESIIKVSEGTYQVDFFVEVTKFGENRSYESKMRGIFSFIKVTSVQYNSMTEEERIGNPMGIYITDYSIVEVS